MKRSRPIIFLDIDGVLCTARSCVRSQGLMQTLDPVGVQMLCQLIEDTDAQLVLSSTWRNHHDQMEMTGYLKNAGMHNVPWHQNWKTPDFKSGPRGEEIKHWLTNHAPNNQNYLILDDDSDMLPEQMDRFVKTDTYNGITWQNYVAAKEILHKFRKDTVV
jgi:FMN phosphatase YigB (HAD superfamily)